MTQRGRRQAVEAFTRKSTREGHTMGDRSRPSRYASKGATVMALVLRLMAGEGSSVAVIHEKFRRTRMWSKVEQSGRGDDVRSNTEV